MIQSWWLGFLQCCCPIERIAGISFQKPQLVASDRARVQFFASVTLGQFTSSTCTSLMYGGRVRTSIIGKNCRITGTRRRHLMRKDTEWTVTCEPWPTVAATSLSRRPVRAVTYLDTIWICFHRQPALEGTQRWATRVCAEYYWEVTEAWIWQRILSPSKEYEFIRTFAQLSSSIHLHS